MLADNVHNVRLTIEKALAVRALRRENFLTGSTVTVVAVTKNHPAELVSEALALGLTNIGENRVQEAFHKQSILGKQGIWHLIGHLQSNKVRQAVALFDLIESVDSEKLLRAIDREAGAVGKRQEVLLQLNIAGEEQKTGFAVAEYKRILPLLRKLANIEVCGLMIMAPKCNDSEAIRPVFAEGYRYFCELKDIFPRADTLSMGMSGDFTVAVEEGANQIRLGTVLFGERGYHLEK